MESNVLATQKQKFRSRANNNKSLKDKVCEERCTSKASLKQKTNITVQIDNATEDWSITKDSPDTLKELRRKELYWMYKLKTYAQYHLNERDVYKVF